MIPFAANAVAMAIAKIANAFEWPRQPSKIAPSPWDFVTMPEEDRAMAIGSMHRKIDKDHACGSGDTLVDGQTYTHRQACSSQYCATAPVGEVINSEFNR